MQFDMSHLNCLNRGGGTEPIDGKERLESFCSMNTIKGNKPVVGVFKCNINQKGLNWCYKKQHFTHTE